MSNEVDVRALIAEARDACVHYARHEWEWKLLQRLADALEAAHAEPDDDEKWALSNFLFSVYDHGTNPNAAKEADAILAFLSERGFRRRGTPATVEQVADALEVMLRSSWSENATWLAERIEGRFIVLNREPTEGAD